MNEKEVFWMNRPAKTLRRVETLVRQAADKINWDGDMVWGMVKERLANDEIAAYNDTSTHFGFHVAWDGDKVDVYMYSD
jgi:hypothetical protein